jgi:hypothetical protein
MRRIAIVLVFVTCLVLVAPAYAESQPVGTIRVFGTWIVDGRSIANDTTPALDGAVVRIAGSLSAEQRRAARAIVYYSVPGQDPLQCRGAEACASGFRVRARNGVDPILTKILSYFHPQAEPDLALARGTAQTVPDGVVQRDGKTLAIGPLLTTVTPGAYRIVVTRRNGNARAVVANELLDIRGAAASIETTDPLDGLYALQLLDPSTLEPAGDVAWFAAAAPPAYAVRRATFDRALAETRSWSPTPQNRAAATALLRDLVVALADPAWHP